MMDMNDLEFAQLNPKIVEQIKILEGTLKTETNHEIVLLAYEKRSTEEVAKA